MSHPLDILFLTNFSDFCFRAIPAIADLADSFSTRVTLMHVYDPKRCTKASAQQLLNSFFPEADRFSCTRRVAVPGPLIDAVKNQLAAWPVNLIVAPSSDPIGFPRIAERSLRARLIEECGVPVWTMGRRVATAKLLQRPRSVACWLDFRWDRNEHLPFAIDYADKIGAELHLLRALPPIDEGSLLPASHPRKALHPAGATDEILRLCANAPIVPRIHVSSGDGRAVVSRMLREIAADIVFLRNEEWPVARWFGFGPWLDHSLPCPAFYVGDRLEVPVWNLESGPRHRTTVAKGDEVRTRARNGISHSILAELGLL